MQSVKNLLHGIVDYAGLFPPAALRMSAGVRNYARYGAGPYSWMLGRFVVQTGRLEEIEKELHALPSDPDFFRISALAGADLKADAERIADFNRRRPRHASIVSAEFKPADPSHVAAAAASVAGLETYFEIPISSDPAAYLDAIAQAGAARAKFRTGGVTADMIPAASSLIQIIEQLSRRKIAFKATAGLHHALPGTRPLTYEANAPRAAMHGFLNVFLAAAGIWHGLDAASAGQLLQEQKFVFDDAGVQWGEYRLSNEQLREARNHFALAFGSCSFEEPVADLEALHLI